MSGMSGRVRLYSKALVALDGSLTAEAALGFLPLVIESEPGDEVILLTIVETDEPQELERGRAYVARTAAELEEWWRTSGRQMPLLHSQAVSVGHAEPGRPPGRVLVAERIIQVAEASNVDLVVLAANGWSGSDRWLAGGTAELVMQMAGRSVLLVRADDYRRLEHPQVRRLLIPLDGSGRAERSLPYARSVAARAKAESAVLLHVRLPDEGAASRVMRPTWDFRPFPKGEAGAYLRDAAMALANDDIAVDTSHDQGDPGPRIVEAAKQAGADFIVMASHGRSGWEERPFGKVADDILHAAPVPVLMIHTGPTSDA